MLNICFFIGDFNRCGGTERVTTNIANELSKLDKNYSVFILSIRNENTTNFFSLRDVIKTHNLYNEDQINKKSYIQTFYRLRKFIVKQNIDILIDVDSMLDLFSLPASFFIKTKLISWEHFNYYYNLGVVHRSIARILSSKFADAIVTLTNEDRGYFIKNLSPKCMVKRIYNPIFVTEIDNIYNSKSKTILSAGRLTHQKGFDYLIDVAKIVLEKHHDWEWIILGEGEDRPLLENKISQYNLHNRVILKGNVSNINDYYKNSSMFVMTSRYEGLPLVLLEAKSFVLPCVSFRCKTGPSEIILDGANGYLVNCFDIDEMANKISILIENEDLRREFSARSLDDTEKFNIDEVIKDWIELFEYLIKN